MKANIKMKKVIHDLKPTNSKVFEKALELGLNKLEATILANRTNDVDNLIKYVCPRYSDIMDYSILTDVSIATDIICESIKKQELIAIVGDYDCDKFTYIK